MSNTLPPAHATHMSATPPTPAPHYSPSPFPTMPTSQELSLRNRVRTETTLCFHAARAAASLLPPRPALRLPAGLRCDLMEEMATHFPVAANNLLNITPQASRDIQVRASHPRPQHHRLHYGNHAIRPHVRILHCCTIRPPSEHASIPATALHLAHP